MNDEDMVRMSGGEALAKMLRLAGAEFAFGMGGFQLLPFYDAISRDGNRRPRHILVHDERSGAFAADAFARVSGRIGFCDGTLGPGATNLATGLVESATAGIPVVALIGDSNRDYSGKNMTQETRQTEILTPIVKELIRVERGSRIPELLRRAFNTAVSGRPGPVILNIPEDFAHKKWEFPREDLYVEQHACLPSSRRIRPDAGELKKVAELLRKAKRPVLLVGGGIHLSGAYAEIRDFAETLNVPVAYTLSGKGALPCAHPLCLDLFGRFDWVANGFIKNADLLIGLGCKFGEVATARYTLIPKGVDLVHIDILPEEICRYQRVKVGLWADARSALVDLMEEIRSDAAVQKTMRRGYVAEILQKKREWQETNRELFISDERPVNMVRLCGELTKAMPPNGILLADGGFAAHWTGLLYDVPAAGRTFVANRGNASIGYGVPGGIGAQLAAKEAPVVAVTGDGGFLMSMGGLETAIRERIPVVWVIVNNAASGYVKGLQHALFQGRYQSSDLNELNYARIAREMGARGIRVEDPKDLAGALKEGVAERSGPTVIDVVVTRDPARMLPAVDARVRMTLQEGDRPI
jgi:acetolactate synthase-1/2/3 large subunit